AAPGLSGAPLVYPVRRAVVGVVTATRDPGSELGGWAAPVAPLLIGAPGLPESVIAHGQRLATANRTVVLADRGGWHAVLPVPGAAEALDRPWAAFVRRPRSSPADLLRADYGVVPYLFRDGDLAAGQRWCEQASPMEIASVAGRGGAGKTRYAIELCRRMIGRGWLAGVWRAPDATVATVPLPRLVVVDDVEEIRTDTLRTLLDQLWLHATPLAPVRVLLLTRTGVGSGVSPLDHVGRRATAALRTVLDNLDEPDTTRVLTVPEREELYRTAVARFRAAWS